MNGLAALLSDYTLRTVIAGAALIGALAGTVGSFAVLRRQSLLGDVLAHAALPGICAGFLIAGGRAFGALAAGAFAAGLLAAAAVVALSGRPRIRPDTALAITLSLAFALGVVLLTRAQARGGAAQAGLERFLFGQAAAMLREDVLLIAAGALMAAAVIAAFWKEFQLVAFDPEFARVQGLPVRAVSFALTALIALAVVLGVQMVGVVLMTALMIAPAAAARQWVGRLAPMLLLAAAIGATAGVAGALVSATARGLATGPLVVLAASAAVALSLLFAPGRGIVAVALAARAAQRRLAGRRVLDSLAALARAHDDPAYPAEQGMVRALHGRGSEAALARLAAAGLVRSVPHPPEATPHWALTEAGHRAAAAQQAGDGDPPGPEEAPR